MTTSQATVHTSSLTSLTLLARGKVRDNYAVVIHRIDGRQRPHQCL